MISQDGAGLIAQLLLVGVLVLAVERRALGAEAFPRGRGGMRRARQVWWWVRFAASGLIGGASVLAVAFCVVAVSSGRPLVGGEATFVGLMAALLGVLVIGVVVSLSMRAFSGATSEEE
jgi:hypothetical protein